MFDLIGRPFFAALARAAEAQLGAQHPCTEALRQAAAMPEPPHVATAQAQLAGLSEDQRNRILTEAQASLRLDPSLLASASRSHAGEPNLH